MPEVFKRVSLLSGVGLMDRRTLLVIETIVLVAPTALIVAWGIPHMLAEILRIYRFGSPANISPEGWIGAFGVIGGALALGELIRLAMRTIAGRRYRFGPVFLIAVALGVVAVHEIQQLFGVGFAIFVSAPLVFLAFHMYRLQKKLPAE